MPDHCAHMIDYYARLVPLYDSLAWFGRKAKARRLIHWYCRLSEEDIPYGKRIY